jgi:hypothetical protein
LVGLGRGIRAFEVSGSCESIEEAVFDILKLEIRGICSMKTRLWLQECLKILESCQEYSKDRTILMAHTKTSNYL